MADVPINQLLQRLDGAATPDPAFGDALYERIAPLALAAVERIEPGRPDLGNAPVAVDRSLPDLDPRFRTVVIATALLLLAVAIAIVIGSRRPDPNQLVHVRKPSTGSARIRHGVAYSDGALRRFRYDGQPSTRWRRVGTYRVRQEGSHLIGDARRAAQ